MPRTVLTTVAVFVLIAGIPAQAASPPASPLSALPENSSAQFFRQRVLHDFGSARVKVGNDGSFGGWAEGSAPGPDEDLQTPDGGDATFEFPARSGCMYSFLGGLWFAGMIGVDTLASMAATSGSSTLLDFYGRRQIERHVDSLRGHQRFTCVYYDTAIASWRLGAWDRAPGIEVRQTSHAFASPPYDRFILIDYLIRNRSGQTIRRPYVGFFDDADIANMRAGHLREDGPRDDIAGFIPSHTIAYALDNDGDPHGDTVWVPTSSVGAMGIAPVYADPLPHDTSFNWWATDFRQLTWAPMRPSPDYPYNSSLPYLPSGPRQVYWTMANHEKDYDQLWSAVDMSGEGWRRPRLGPAAENLANGLDTRILLSFGFPDMEPGDSIRIVIAVAAGDSVHVHPADFARLFDPLHPQNLYSQFDFSDLIRNVEMARAAWASNFDLYGAAPARLTLTPVADDAVKCEWTPAPFYHVTGYRLYDRPLGDTTWNLVAETNAGKLMEAARGLEIGKTYEFVVASLDWSGIESPKSKTSQISTAVPTAVPSLQITSLHPAVGLNWAIPPQDTALAPLRTVNVYRSTGSGSAYQRHATVPIATTSIGRSQKILCRDPFGMSPYAFVDDSVTPGMRYSYRVSVSNLLDLEGQMSEPVSTIPLTLEHRGLVILRTRVNSALVDPDPQREFYSSWASHYGFDVADPEYPGSEYDAVLALRNLARFECVMFVVEDPYDAMYHIDDFDASVLKYGFNGGRCVFILRNQGMPDFIRPGHYYAEPTIEKLMGVHSILKEFPVWSTSYPAKKWVGAQFLEAMTQDPSYPDVDGDSARGWNFQFLENHAVTADTIVANGHTPAIGAIGNLDTTTHILYTYQSAFDTSIYHGKPIAVKRITDTSAAVLFNFPLSLMKREQAWRALTQAVVDLGIDTTNYWTPPVTTNRAIIEWLYGKSSTKPNPDWDVNHDGMIDIRDVVSSIKR